MFRSIFRESCSFQDYHIVKRFIKKFMEPPNLDPGADLPVYSYPKKKPGSNIVYVWGLCEHGALGTYLQKRKKMKSRADSRFRSFNRPVRLTFGELFTVTDIAAGFGFSLFAVKAKGDLKVFGSGINTDSQLGYQESKKANVMGILTSPVPVKLPFQNPRQAKVICIAAGRAHSVVVTDSEGVFTLGNNAYGQCGRKIVENEKYEGSSVVHNIKDFDGHKIVFAECGQDHTLFLTENGSVYGCGWGADGQTGLGHTQNESRPTKLLGDLQGEKIVKLSSRSDCVLALNEKGQVFGWGNSEYCQILDESVQSQQINTPIHMKKCEGFGKIIDVAAAGSVCLMLNEHGEVFSWGFGILGRGPEAFHSWKPELIPPILFGRNQFAEGVRVEKIFAGLNHYAAINSNGDIFTWGKNKGACLGLGDDQDKFFPLRRKEKIGIKMNARTFQSANVDWKDWFGLAILLGIVKKGWMIISQEIS